VDKALAVRGANEKSSIKCNLEIVAGKEMPELSIIDYLIWAVQRKLITGESRYFEALEYQAVAALPYGILLHPHLKIKSMLWQNSTPLPPPPTKKAPA
jgi:hypothetical protein